MDNIATLLDKLKCFIISRNRYQPSLYTFTLKWDPNLAQMIKLEANIQHLFDILHLQVSLELRRPLLIYRSISKVLHRVTHNLYSLFKRNMHLLSTLQPCPTCYFSNRRLPYPSYSLDCPHGTIISSAYSFQPQ